MAYDPKIHHRRSIRLKEYDYSRVGGYFVTICTFDKKCVLGNIIERRMVLSNIGKVVDEFWPEISRHFCVGLDEFVVMPNHVHGVIMIGCGDSSPQPQGGETPPLRTPALGQIVAYYKYQTTKLINQIHNTPGAPVWQRNYYEHVIRNDDDLNEIREYIINNPLKWDLDKENPQNANRKGEVSSPPVCKRTSVYKFRGGGTPPLRQ